MKLFFEEYLWPILLLFIGVLADITLRSFSIQSIDFLVAPFLSVNIIEIIIFTIFLVLGYRLMPPIYRKLKKQRRAEQFVKNWDSFKNLLLTYELFGPSKNSTDERKYAALRSCLEKDFNYFLDDIIEIQRRTHREYKDLVLSNFEACWSPRDIFKWKDVVQRQVPNELEGFDYIPISLIENLKK